MIVLGNYYVGKCDMFGTIRYGKLKVAWPGVSYQLGTDDYSFTSQELSPLTVLDIFLLFGDRCTKE